MMLTEWYDGLSGCGRGGILKAVGLLFFSASQHAACQSWNSSAGSALAPWQADEASAVCQGPGPLNDQTLPSLDANLAERPRLPPGNWPRGVCVCVSPFCVHTCRSNACCSMSLPAFGNVLLSRYPLAIFLIIQGTVILYLSFLSDRIDTPLMLCCSVWAFFPRRISSYSSGPEDKCIPIGARQGHFKQA